MRLRSLGVRQCPHFPAGKGRARALLLEKFIWEQEKTGEGAQTGGRRRNNKDLTQAQSPG